MKLHMRFDESNAKHTRFTVFIDGRNCGQLCCGTEDVVSLHMILAHGCSPDLDYFVSSGKVFDAGEVEGAK